MLVLVALVMGAADGGVGGGLSLSPSEVYARVSSSVLFVRTPLGTGSAVVVGPELVVTNHHVIDGAKSVVVSFGDAKWDATVSKFDAAHDVALLRVPGLRRASPRRRPLGGLRVGERVYALGAPAGLELTFSEGIVSALRVPPPKNLLPLQHTAPIAPGSSGGGLFDERGRLVGLNTLARFANVRGENELVGDLNFAVPVDWVEELLSAQSAAPAAPAFTALRRPSALECTMLERHRYAPDLHGELNQLVAKEPVSGKLYVLNFHQEVAEVREGDLFAGQQWEVVLSAIDSAAGVVQFVGSTRPGLTFVLSNENAVAVWFQQRESLRGQPRRVLSVGACEPFDFSAQSKLHDEAVARQQATFRAEQLATMGAASSEARCEAGSVDACNLVAQQGLDSGSEGSAALYFKKACMLGAAGSCQKAYDLYLPVNAMKAAEALEKWCQLGGCPPRRPPAR